MYLCSDKPVQLVPMPVTFGGWLTRLRESRGLSIRSLAVKANISHATVSKLEDSLVGASPETVRKLAEALGVEAAEAFRVWSEDAAASQGVELTYERDPDLATIIEFYEGNPTKRRVLRGMVDLLAEGDDILDPSLEERVRAAEKAKEKG